MARVTIEDCTLKIPSRFELVVLAAQRAREIAAGAKPAVERDNDKNPVVALREIAADLATPAALEELLLKKFRKHQIQEQHDLPDEDDAAFSEEIAKEMKSFTPSTMSEEDIEEDGEYTFVDESESAEELE